MGQLAPALADGQAVSENAIESAHRAEVASLLEQHGDNGRRGSVGEPRFTERIKNKGAVLSVERARGRRLGGA